MPFSEWFAAYTFPRHEKKADALLRLRGVETFLPLFREAHHWKNGVRSIVEMPLFPGYLFVHIRSSEKLKVLQTPSVAALVGSGGIPTPIRAEELERLRAGVHLGLKPHPYISAGDRVRIKSGPLSQMEGVLLSFKNNWRVVISIELLRQSVSVEVDLCEIERLPAQRLRA